MTALGLIVQQSTRLARLVFGFKIVLWYISDPLSNFIVDLAPATLSGVPVLAIDAKTQADQVVVFSVCLATGGKIEDVANLVIPTVVEFYAVVAALIIVVGVIGLAGVAGLVARVTVVE
jgi:hypothetical protein